MSGSVTLTFDPSLAISGASVDSISLDIGGFKCSTAGTAFGFNGLDLFVDGTLNGTAMLPGSDDFFLEGIVNRQGQFTFSPTFIYSTADSSAVFAARDVSVSTSVPEPRTLWLSALGLALLGVLRRVNRSARSERR